VTPPYKFAQNLQIIDFSVVPPVQVPDFIEVYLVRYSFYEVKSKYPGFGRGISAFLLLVLF